MIRLIGVSLFLFALWLGLSGVYKPLVIGLGVASCVITAWFLTRMDRYDEDRLHLNIRLFAFAKYVVWLLREMLTSSFTVARVILSPGGRINQQIFEVPVKEKQELAQVIFANSITLTPGTITVETEDDHFIVHALSLQGGDKDAIDDMGRRCLALETR